MFNMMKRQGARLAGGQCLSFERPEDAVEAMGFDGVALVGVAMVVKIGEGLDQCEQ